MLSSVTHVRSTTEFLEANQVRELATQFEKQVRTSGEAIVRAVVDNRWQRRGSLQDGREVSFLGRRRCAAGQYARNNHQTMGADFGGVGGMRHGFFSVHGAGADDSRYAGSDQTSHAFLTLGFGQQRPVTHRTAVHDGAHTDFDQLAAFLDECVKIRLAVRGARGHECWNSAGEDIVAHCDSSNIHSGRV
ncbi:hypothetical protein D3C81_1645450 [compost metagenome]